jgi:hypothetical protein
MFSVINRYIAIVNNPDPDERHMHSTDNWDINMNMLGFMFASGLAVIFRIMFIIDKSEKSE